LIVTFEVDGAHPPNSEVMVHVRTVVNPTVSPVTAELGSFADEAVPEPENVVQVPVSETLTEFAASVPEVTPQRFCVGPAAEMVVIESTLIVTSEVVGAHPAFAEVIVHRSTVVKPTVSPATAEPGSFNDEAAPEPENVDHVPVSVGLGVLAASVAVVTLHRFWLGPATAIVVVESEVIVTSEVVTAQPPLCVVMVHLRTDVSPTAKAVTPETGSLRSVIRAVPDKTAQPPESVPVGEFAARVAIRRLHKF
jgi:hypothetical protein